ncbi:MAG: hypothetical protein HC896_18070 [Bacteroidales bacterium]|nr:hypothetical protein [Bacteroidales bacterium]
MWQAKKKLIVQQLNKKLSESLLTVVHINTMQATFLRTFPNAGLRLGNVSMLSGKDFNAKDFSGQDQPLLNADLVTIEISLPDLMRKKVNFKNIAISNATINVYVDRQGVYNTNIWKPSSTSAQKETHVDFENIALRNCSINYQNLLTSHSAQATISKSKNALYVNNDSIFVKANVSMVLKRAAYKSLQYNKPLEIEISSSISIGDRDLVMQPLLLTINKMPFIIAGNINNYKSKPYLNVTCQVKIADLKMLAETLPDSLLAKVNNKATRGKLIIDGTAQGDISNGKLPYINAQVRLYDAKCKLTKGPKFNNLEITANYTNGMQRNAEFSEVNIDNASFDINDSQVVASGQITNFSHPYLNVKLAMDANLHDLSEHLANKLVSFQQGHLKGEFLLKGGLQQPLTAKLFAGLIKKGELLATNVQLKHVMAGTIDCDTLYAVFSDACTIKKLNFRALDANVQATGTLLAYKNLFAESPRLDFDGNINASYVDFYKWLSAFSYYDTSQQVKADTAKRLYYSINTNCSIDQLAIDEFNMTYFKAQVIINPLEIILNNSSFNACQGEVFAGGMLRFNNSQVEFLRTQADIKPGCKLVF